MALSRFVLTNAVTVPAGTIIPLLEVNPSNPAAATNFVYVNQTGQPQLLQSLQALLTTSATVGNRFPQVQLNDAAGNIIAYTIDATAVVASSTLTIDAYVGASQINAASGTFTAPLPNEPIPPGGKVSIAAVWQAGDQLSNIFLNFAQSGEQPSAVVGGTTGWYGANDGWAGGNFPVTWQEGMVIWADSSAGSNAAQLLYQAIGAGNLRAYVQGQDDVGHAALAN